MYYICFFFCSALFILYPFSTALIILYLFSINCFLINYMIVICGKSIESTLPGRVHSTWPCAQVWCTLEYRMPAGNEYSRVRPASYTGFCYDPVLLHLSIDNSMHSNSLSTNPNQLLTCISHFNIRRNVSSNHVLLKIRYECIFCWTICEALELPGEL